MEPGARSARSSEWRPAEPSAWGQVPPSGPSMAPWGRAATETVDMQPPVPHGPARLPGGSQGQGSQPGHTAPAPGPRPWAGACSHHAFCTLSAWSLEAHRGLSLTSSIWAARARVAGGHGLCPWSGAAVTPLPSPVGGSHAPRCPAPPQAPLCSCPLGLRCEHRAYAAGGTCALGLQAPPCPGDSRPPGGGLG